MNRKRKIRLAVVALSTLIIVAYVPQIPGCLVSHLPKVGTVVDSSTGLGMPNVAIVGVTAITCSSDGLIESHTATHYRTYRIGMTDDAGEYRLPGDSVIEGIYLLPNFGRCHDLWTIAPLKPGYATSGDDFRIDKTNPNAGRTLRRGYVSDEVPEHTFSGISISIAPINLAKVDMTFQESSSYYARMLNGRSAADRNAKDDGNFSGLLKDELLDYLAAKVCDPGWKSTIKTNYLGLLIYLEPTKFITSLRRVAPSKFVNTAPTPIPVDRAEFLPEEVCQSIKMGR